MPFVLGGTAAKSTNIYGITVDPSNLNIVVSGYTANITITTGDVGDAYVMRLSTTGIIEWMSNIYVGAATGSECSKMVGINAARNAVYASFERFDSPTSMVAILKLTYSEGKLVWSKRVNLKQTRNVLFYELYGSNELLIDPSDTSSFMLSHHTNLNIPSYSYV